MEKLYIMALMGLALTIPGVTLGSGTNTAVATVLQGTPRTIDSTRPNLVAETRTTLRLQQFLETLTSLSARLDAAITLATTEGVEVSDSIKNAQEQLRITMIEAETAVTELSEESGKNFIEKRLRARSALTSAYKAMKDAVKETNQLFISQ
jgi:CMP-N-acetylneuraminic acid synthetase